MPSTLIESDERGRIAYDSLLVSDPTALSAFSNKLSLKIIKTLSEKPSCALDIARKLKVHEQKVYYHLKHLEKTGIVYPISTERRHGMIAKIYSVVSPVIAAKLFEKGFELKENIITNNISPEIVKFFSPFIEDGKLNSLIVVGDTYSHGRFDKESDECNYMLDFIIFLGTLINEWNLQFYKLDIKTHENELKNNLILIGNNRTNSIIDKVNKHLSVCFDESGKEIIISKISGKNYSDPRTGLIIKTINPFDKTKKILIVGGIGRRGSQSASLAIVNRPNNLTQDLKSFDDIVKVVKGFDENGDDVIDSVKILE